MNLREVAGHGPRKYPRAVFISTGFDPLAVVPRVSYDRNSFIIASGLTITHGW